MNKVEKLVRDNIKDIIHLSLATSKENKPWVCELHFAYDKNLNLYFRSLASRRHSQEITANPNVAGNIIKQHGLSDEPLGVYFEGTAKVLNQGPEQNVAFKCLKLRLEVKDRVLEEAKDPKGHQFYKISVENFYVFGVFDGKGQKLKLAWNR